MANSYLTNLYHLVWSTKKREPLISQAWEARLWEYMAGIVRRLDGHPIQIGGMEDHVHLLIERPKRMLESELVGKVKSNATRWVNDERLVPGRFSWQDGFAAVSVSPSQIEKVQEYIRDQREGHKKLSFMDEYRIFVEKNRAHGTDKGLNYLFG